MCIGELATAIGTAIETVMLPTFLALALLFSAPVLAAASFDCAKAGTSIERMICGDRDLSQLDDTLTAVFTTEVERADGAAVRAGQKQWIAARHGCADAACVRRRYEERIVDLACDPTSAA
jgi:uncharacterized protein